MISAVQALRFRCLRYVDVPLSPFMVMVGANASGKTTFLDVVGFLGQLVADGPERAIQDRAHDFRELLWLKEGKSFELAVEAELPPERRGSARPDLTHIRYEVELGLDEADGSVGLLNETVMLKGKSETVRDLEVQAFPCPRPAPATLMLKGGVAPSRRVVSKSLQSHDKFYPEDRELSGKRWMTFRLGSHKSALGNLPDDPEQFPAATWLRELLTTGTLPLALNSSQLRASSRPNLPRRYQADGSNLPWVIQELADSHPEVFSRWLRHLRTALPDLIGVRSVLREEDRNRYLMLKYANGLEVPSWMASDGTLRLLALTLPAYLPELRGLYLIEEPENGIHPLALESLVQSLSSVWSAQVLVATHAPQVLGLLEPSQILCFAKDEDGATDIVRGDQHPRLLDWKAGLDLSMLFAAGVLG